MKKILGSSLLFSNELPSLTNLHLTLFMGKDVSAVTSEESHFWTWGGNHFEKLGYSTYPNAFSKYPQLTSCEVNFSKGEYVTHISFGFDHVGFLTNTGDLLLTGKNEYGQLGMNKEHDFFVFLKEKFNFSKHEKIIAIHMNDYRSLALTNQNNLYFWGLNDSSKLNNSSCEYGLLYTPTNRSLKPTLINEILHLKKDEKISHFQLNHSKKSPLIMVINHQQVYEVNYQKKKDISKAFRSSKPLRIKKLLSQEGMNLILTNNNELFIWGSRILGENYEILSPLAIHEKINLTNDKILDVVMNQQFIFILTDNSCTLCVSIENKLFKVVPLLFKKLLVNQETIKGIGCNDNYFGMITSLNRVLTWTNEQVISYEKNEFVPTEHIFPFID